MARSARARNAFLAAVFGALLLVPLTGCIHPYRRPVPVSIELPPGQTTIELPATFKDGWILVDATINGHGPHRLILDTGASGWMVEPATAEAIGLTPSITSRILDSADVIADYPTAFADEIRLGPMSMGPCPIIITDTLGSTLSDIGAVGIVGYPGFARFTLDLDYPAEKVRVSIEPIRATDPGAVPLRRVSNGTPRALLKLRRTNGPPQPLWFDIDSGGSFFLEIAERHAEDWSHTRLAIPLDRGVSLSGATRDRNVSPLRGDLAIGDATVAHPTAVAGTNDSLVGHALLRLFRVRLDPRSGLAAFTLPGDARTVSAPRIAGLGIADAFIIDGRAIVTEIYKDSPAHRAGILPGTAILAVNSMPVDDLDDELAYWSDEPPTDLTLTIAGENGGQRDVIVRHEYAFPSDPSTAPPREILEISSLIVEKQSHGEPQGPQNTEPTAD